MVDNAGDAYRALRLAEAALFHAQRYESAALEFEAQTAISPTDDYALFCLGRSMQLLGRHREACRALSLASSMRRAVERFSNSWELRWRWLEFPAAVRSRRRRSFPM